MGEILAKEIGKLVVKPALRWIRESPDRLQSVNQIWLFCLACMTLQATCLKTVHDMITIAVISHQISIVPTRGAYKYPPALPSVQLYPRCAPFLTT
jgi:hypothetical protein